MAKDSSNSDATGLRATALLCTPPRVGVCPEGEDEGGEADAEEARGRDLMRHLEGSRQ